MKHGLMQRRKLLLGATVAVSVGAVIALVVLGRMNQMSLLLASETGQRDSGITDDGFPYLGSSDAPVQIVEFTDYFCATCRELALDTVPRIVANFVARGEVQYVVQPFALKTDERLILVEAAFCAARQGRFFDYHRMLFANQSQLAAAQSESRLELLCQIAGELELDVASFRECLYQNVARDTVLKSIVDGNSKGIHQTPTVVIDGDAFVGNRPYEWYQEAIDKALESRRRRE